MLVSFLRLGDVKKLFGWLEVQYEDRFVLELVFENKTSYRKMGSRLE